MLNDFIIITDTREQDRLFKNPPKGVLIVKDTLHTGDYSVRGFESNICIERKSMFDFLNSITNDRERFKQCLERMKTFEKKFIVVECALKELLLPVEYKRGYKSRVQGYVKPSCKTYIQVNPNVILSSIVSIMLRYDCIFFFAENKKQCEDFVLSTLKKYYLLKRSKEL